MNITQLFNQLIPGLVPILIFVVIDEFLGTKAGILAALIFGAIQLIYYKIKEGRVEKFVLIDTLLIIIMGLTSILLNNDHFFKLKPVIIETILLAILGVSAFSKYNYLLSMTQRMASNSIDLKGDQINQMQIQLRILFFIVLFHSILSVYATYYLSTQLWAFITTFLLYILLGIFFIIQFGYQYFKNKNVEFLPVVNEEGKIMGKASRQECHRNPNLMYPVVRLHLFNQEGKLLLQKRHQKSDIEPNKWDASVAGHVHFNESIENALIRECQEELNHTLTDFQLIQKRIYRGKSTALMFIFVGQINQLPRYNPKEVTEVGFFTLTEVNNLIKGQVTTQGLIEEYDTLKQIKISKTNKTKDA
jgi:isopentenyldiphosphate isomerase/intracellular septation protein A